MEDARPDHVPDGPCGAQFPPEFVEVQIIPPCAPAANFVPSAELVTVVKLPAKAPLQTPPESVEMYTPPPTPFAVPTSLVPSTAEATAVQLRVGGCGPHDVPESVDV